MGKLKARLIMVINFPKNFRDMSGFNPAVRLTRFNDSHTMVAYL
jgi:hypothetical protein